MSEYERLDSKWIDERKRFGHLQSSDGIDFDYFVNARDLKNLLVPKQEVLSDEQIARKVDQAYKDGYEKGKQHTFDKGYLEGLADKEKEPETVASVIADFYKSLERLKEVLGMEVEELEE